MGVTGGRRTSELGSLYKGREGQWSWIAHRVTGVGILLFLFAHIVDTALVGWGPDAYNRVVSIYHHPIVQVMEFWPSTADHQARLFWGTMLVFVASMVPITWIMGSRIIEELFG